MNRFQNYKCVCEAFDKCGVDEHSRILTEADRSKIVDVILKITEKYPTSEDCAQALYAISKQRGGIPKLAAIAAELDKPMSMGEYQQILYSRIYSSKDMLKLFLVMLGIDIPMIGGAMGLGLYAGNQYDKGQYLNGTAAIAGAGALGYGSGKLLGKYMNHMANKKYEMDADNILASMA